MFTNYMSVAVRNLIKNKLYSIINILGLSIGLAACVLIMLYVRDELSFDAQWSKGDRIGRMHVVFQPPEREPFRLAATPGPIRNSLQNYFAQDLEAVSRFATFEPVITLEDKVVPQQVTWVDRDMLKMLELTVLEGSMEDALRDTASIALSQKTAERVFGRSDVVGEVISMATFSLARDYRVGAVYVEPDHTMFLLPAVTLIDEADFTDEPYLFEGWFSVNTETYFMLKPGATLESFDARLDDWANASIPRRYFPEGTTPSDIAAYSAMALRDLRLHNTFAGGRVSSGTGETVMVFSAIAGLILVIACINFMNLATAKSTQRAREVALRKVLGAHRANLIMQFLGESALVALIALVLSIAFVELSLPAFADFIGKDLVLELANGTTLWVMVGLVLMVGMVGGFYPALVLSGFRPARVLKANKSSAMDGSSALRSVLVVVQFAISIALIVSTTVVYAQKIYATNLNPGFSKENLLVVRNLGREGALEIRPVLRQQVAAMPGVIVASLVAETPAWGNENNESVTLPGRAEDDTPLIGVQNVDEHYVDAFKIELLAGRNFDPAIATDTLPGFQTVPEGEVWPANVMVNQTALRRMGYPEDASALGKTFQIGNGVGAVELTIIGILPDMQFQSLKRSVRPEMVRLNPQSLRNLVVRFAGDPTSLIAEIEALWKELAPNVPFEYHFVDEIMAEEFAAETATATMLALFSGLAVLIACLGLYGLASFTAERRTKEIGIRKVLGARVVDIVRLLLWQFSKPVLIANLIAWPVAAWGTLMWLEEFPYRLEAWVLLPLCALAGFIALLIAWLTVGGNAARVARANPISALRYE